LLGAEETCLLETEAWACIALSVPVFVLAVDDFFEHVYLRLHQLVQGCGDGVRLNIRVLFHLTLLQDELLKLGRAMAGA